MTIYEDNLDEVKLSKFPDLGDTPFSRKEFGSDSYCEIEPPIGQNSLQNQNHEQDMLDVKTKQAEISDGQIEVAEDMENFNSACNIFEARGFHRQKNTGDECSDTDSSLENGQESGRIIMLDLDNTLIPTNWIMQTWRNAQYELGNDGDCIDYSENETELYELTKQIREELVQVGLFDSLEKLFSDLWGDGKAFKIIIITNAGVRTVELFYLKYCLPKLGELLKRHNVEIRSTEEYIKKKGPPPSPFKECEYREFYTNAKLYEFQRVLLDCWSNCTMRTNDTPTIFDIISAGDQACEMTAACRISKFYENKIRRTKLVYIHDPEDLRFWNQKPESFITQLSETHRELLNILCNDSETLIGMNDMNSTGFTVFEEENEGENEEFEEVALGWHYKGKYINIAVSRPERFILPVGSSEIYVETEKEYFEKGKDLAQ
ncbi:hypothetical protein OIY81_259 [Cryptosporidium canis]|uniref:Swiss Army Knife RNA repair protein HAD domain-containing protein n=1 Tax=Cryptosporidium canis TaxID=195482 RepID=A0ABQ8P6S4_9CRYT|nr:hypothetical protein OJ252_2179 [Cryptosporidium canis]KAJ1614806.1 hypothetical protein OIY81_259 [Cryptosporidium canis]